MAAHRLLLLLLLLLQCCWLPVNTEIAGSSA
jgi:hypothetical protein